ncbi:MAG: hypothetical protein CFE23_04600 [Flavobacterium sp. BFFFF1]|nr:MAG: hypothetical protein CFE23_04600 [Flavobacterium sp. BFFFF1]
MLLFGREGWIGWNDFTSLCKFRNCAFQAWLLRSPMWHLYKTDLANCYRAYNKNSFLAYKKPLIKKGLNSWSHLSRSFGRTGDHLIISQARLYFLFFLNKKASHF